MLIRCLNLPIGCLKKVQETLISVAFYLKLFNFLASDQLKGKKAGEMNNLF
jgi:hypothetical protein